MLAVMLIFCDYARPYAPLLLLIVQKRGNYSRGYAHFFPLNSTAVSYVRAAGS